ncbi:MAG: hypothetical protein ACRD22_14265 [Terriglobia bacterium]
MRCRIGAPNSFAMNKHERGQRALRMWGALGCLVFTLCGTAPFARAQPDPAAAARVYNHCRARADAAFHSERHIDQDILATLGNNWQRADTLSLERSQLFADAAGRANTVLRLCLRSHGAGRAG